VALTKVTGQVINNTTGLVVGVTTVGGGLSATDGFFSGIVTAVGDASFSGNVSVGGTLTYEDVTNIDSVGIITARSDILVGSGITLSPDGDIFFTGIMTGNGSGLTGVANTDVIFTDKLGLGDGTATSGDQINIGVGSDFKLYHNGSHSFIDNNTGDLNVESTNIYIKANNTENAVDCVANGAVTLYHNNSAKLATSASGVTVTGTVAATAVTGDGSGLTGIAAGITTEAASISGITTFLNLSKDDHELVVTGTNTISVIGGAQGTSHTLRLQNSGIATVTLDSTYFKFPSGASPAFPTTSGAISLVSFTVHKAGAVGVNTVLLTGASVSFS
tara:strand:+ start:149 stop:1144 length:996 start_codon:yes stop_codon:yes gene_type:complete